MTVTSSSTIASTRGSATTPPGVPGTIRPRPSVTSSSRFSVARASAAAWYSTPARRSGPYISGASRSTTSASSNAIVPFTSRTPATTATSAVPSIAMNSSAKLLTNADRSVATVSRR